VQIIAICVFLRSGLTSSAECAGACTPSAARACLAATAAFVFDTGFSWVSVKIAP
jgi:hypothetical protein